MKYYKQLYGKTFHGKTFKSQTEYLSMTDFITKYCGENNCLKYMNEFKKIANAYSLFFIRFVSCGFKITYGECYEYSIKNPEEDLDNRRLRNIIVRKLFNYFEDFLDREKEILTIEQFLKETKKFIGYDIEYYKDNPFEFEFLETNEYLTDFFDPHCEDFEFE